MDHPSLSTKDKSTIHTRWHITTSPLYRIEFGDLVDMMEIDSLGDASLPAFLSSEHNPIVQTNDHDDTETSPKKLPVPTNKAKRYNAVNLVARRICDMAKVYQEVFKMVML